jgi:hypothetical protein
MNGSWLFLLSAFLCNLSLCSRRGGKGKNAQETQRPQSLNGRRYGRSLIASTMGGISLEPEPSPVDLPIFASQVPDSNSHLSPLQRACVMADTATVDVEMRRLAARKISKFSLVAILAFIVSLFMDDANGSHEDWIPSSMEGRRIANNIAATLDIAVNGYRLLQHRNSPLYRTENMTMKLLIVFWYFDSIPIYAIFSTFPWLLDHPIVSLLITGAFIVISSVIEVIIGVNIGC